MILKNNEIILNIKMLDHETAEITFARRAGLFWRTHIKERKALVFQHQWVWCWASSGRQVSGPVLRELRAAKVLWDRQNPNWMNLRKTSKHKCWHDSQHYCCEHECCIEIDRINNELTKTKQELADLEADTMFTIARLNLRLDNAKLDTKALDWMEQEVEMLDRDGLKDENVRGWTLETTNHIVVSRDTLREAIRVARDWPYDDGVSPHHYNDEEEYY